MGIDVQILVIRYIVPLFRELRYIVLDSESQ